METKNWMMLKVLINRYYPKIGKELIKFLPAEEQKDLQTQDILSSDILPLLEYPQRVIENMHYSWIKPAIEKMPENMQALLMGSLSPSQIAGIKKETPLQPMAVSKPVKNFLLSELYKILNIKQRLPLEYIPEGGLSILGKWTKNNLTTLINFLGLHDLASEIRYIVNKNYLENIYSCLTSGEFYYLRICLHQKQSLISPKLGINPAVKNCEKLRNTIHQRGLTRLGKALSGEHADFVWYIAHTLDIGRGKILLNYYKPDPIPKVTPILQNQVHNIITFLKKSRT